MNVLTQLLRSHARRRPHKVYWRQVSHGEVVEIVTYGQLARRAAAYARAFQAAGLRPRQVVLIFLPQCAAQMPAFLGAMAAGGIPSFMPCPSEKQHPSVYWPSHKALLTRIGDHLLVTDEHHRVQMVEHGLADDAGRIVAIENVDIDAKAFKPVPATSDTVALLQHSSGTTSLKKGVALSHRAIFGQVQAYAGMLKAEERHNVVSWLPLYHDMGLIACAIMPFVLGQSVTCLDPHEWAARPASLLEAIAHFDGHFVWMPNFGFSHLVRTVPDGFKAELRGVIAFVNCSEPAKAETFEAFASRFASSGVHRSMLQVCYAMAETVFAVSQTRGPQGAGSLAVDATRLQRDGLANPAREGSMATTVMSTGTILPGLSVTIRQDDKVLPERHAGEIAIAGDFLFDAYFHDANTTAERIRDGVYYSRDLGFLADGELYVLGRKDDLLIINGRNLYAHEVEAIVNAVPGIKPGRNVAFGMFNEKAGSDELIIVAESDAGDPEALSQAVRNAVLDQTNFEVKACRIVGPGWLVKTTSGKISRDQNRAKYHQASAERVTVAAPARDQVGGVLAGISTLIESQFGYPAARVTERTVARDVEGWDSLAHATLMLEIERYFGINLSEAEMFRFSSVGEMAARVEELRRSPAAAVRNRIVLDSELATIASYGEACDGRADVIVFAGLEAKFGGLPLLDFASVIGATALRHSRKFYVSDRTRKWYTRSSAQISERLNSVSDRPKILVGNSMGGYAAVHFAGRLSNVLAVLSFVPQVAPPETAAGPPSAELWLDLQPGIRYCVLYGANEDAYELDYMRQRATDRDLHRVFLIPGIGHGLVRHLHRTRKLARILDSASRPAAMGDEIEKILAR